MFLKPNHIGRLEQLKLQITELERQNSALRASAARLRHLSAVAQHYALEERARLGRKGALAFVEWLLGYKKQLGPIAYHALVLDKSGLFDKAYYLQHNPDVAGSDLDPLLHYVLHGAFEGRRPNALFDSGWYLSTYSDVRDAGLNPLMHYYENGEREGRSPSAEFSPKAYLDANSDVAMAGMSPLRHYLKHGRIEGRRTAPTPARFRPSAPPFETFEELARLRAGKTTPLVAESEIVDVIIPVYRGFDDTFACLHSLLVDAVRTPRELVVINDCSPEPEITAQLRRLAALELITLIENEENLGFVATVNRGMRLHPLRDVLLLNSDTEVYGDWLDRLVAHGRRARVASVTPLSNNATICSYPRFLFDNPVPLETAYSEIDRMAEETNPGVSVEVPTGVGFCFYIQRAALNAIGLFNVEEFAKGYGEENDFCFRAINAGWVNLMALDVFVRHTGETSFGDSASASQKRGLETMVRLHPTYLKVVHDFIRKDPARPFRQLMDIERLKRAAPGDERVLCLSHNWGGGIQRYIRDRARQEADKGRGVIVCEPRVGADQTINLQLDAADEKVQLDNLRFLGDGFSLNTELIEALRALDVRRIEIHSLVGWTAEALHEVPHLARTLGIPYTVMLHDYTAICPQINLTDASNFYCGEKGISSCETCLAAKATPSRQIHRRSAYPQKDDAYLDISIVGWRDSYRRLLLGAAQVVAPSRDVADRFGRHIPELAVEVVPHREDLPRLAEPLAATYTGKTPLRVVVIGAIGPHKGSAVLKALASEARDSGRSIEYVVLGYTDDDASFHRLSNVKITGVYQEVSVYDMIRELQCHVALLPSVWPETFSYTLSIASAAGLPTVVFDLGAQGERAAGLKSVTAVPLRLAHQPAELNAVLVEWALECSSRA